MNIHSDDPKWTAYVLGELSGAELAQVERELESSAEAREIVDEIRMMTVLLKDELANQAPATLQPAQRAAIINTASESQPAFFKMPRIGRFALAGAGALVAAMILVAVSVPSLLRSRQAATPPPQISQVPVPVPAASPNVQ